VHAPASEIFSRQLPAICTLISLSISCFQISKHLLNYTEPHLQLYIIRILMMIPVSSIISLFCHPTKQKITFIQVYSTATWLSIMIPNQILAFNTIRDM
jgi:hypothetical protein